MFLSVDDSYTRDSAECWAHKNAKGATLPSVDFINVTWVNTTQVSVENVLVAQPIRDRGGGLEGASL